MTGAAGFDLAFGDAFSKRSAKAEVDTQPNADEDELNVDTEQRPLWPPKRVTNSAQSRYRDIAPGSYRLQDAHLINKMLHRAKRHFTEESVMERSQPRAQSAPGRQ